MSFLPPHVIAAGDQGLAEANAGIDALVAAYRETIASGEDQLTAVGAIILGSLTAPHVNSCALLAVAVARIAEAGDPR